MKWYIEKLKEIENLVESNMDHILTTDVASDLYGLTNDLMVGIKSEKTIKEGLINLMESSIKKVLSGSKQMIKLIGVRPNDVIEFLDKVEKDSYNDDLDPNGWQWDFWISFNIGDYKYGLSGDGFYGCPSFYRDKKLK